MNETAVTIGELAKRSGVAANGRMRPDRGHADEMALGATPDAARLRDSANGIELSELAC
jgi:hypothetical protein